MITALPKFSDSESNSSFQLTSVVEVRVKEKPFGY